LLKDNPSTKIKINKIVVKTSISNSSIITFLSTLENICCMKNSKSSLFQYSIHCTRPFYEMNIGNHSGFRVRGCLSVMCRALRNTALNTVFKDNTLFWNKSEEFSSYPDMPIQNLKFLAIK